MRSSGISNAFRIAVIAGVAAAGPWIFATPAASQDPAPVPACAPPDGAPIWAPGNSAGTGSAGEDPEQAGLVANGRIGGVYYPETQIWLTGLDACEQRIDRSIVTTADGSFLFTGLMPGRYALLDEDGDVLTRLDLTAEAPDQSGLDLAG